MTSVELLAAALWWGPFLLLLRLADRRPRIADFPSRTGIPLSVVIPARNEEATIRTVLDSVLASDYRPLEVVVVDDCSTDDTAAIVREYAARDERVRLVTGEEPPPGWFGKAWACHQGYLASTGELLVFTDADTRHRPLLLGHAVGALLTRPANMITVAPHQLCLTFWERVIMPQVWVILAFQFHPRVVNRARSLRTVIANGQFILLSRDDYEAIGTHEAVRDAVAEDLALAQAMVAGGRTVFFAFATELMETRMYRNLRQLVEGWSKNLYLGGRQALRHHPVLQRLLPTFFALVGAFWLAPPVVLILSHWRALPAGWAAPGGLATAGSVLFWSLVSWGMAIPVWYGLFYPVGVVGLMFVAARSITRGSSRVEWRGRTYRTERSDS